MTRPMDVVLRSAGDRAVPRVITAQGALDDRALAARIDALVAWLAKTGMRRVASRLDNGPSWFVLDLALREIGGRDVQTLFLDCAGAELERRFSETRRRHPMAEDRPAADGIAREREMMEPLRRWAEHVIDTTNYSSNDLQQEVRQRFGDAGQQHGLASFVQQVRGVVAG